MRKDISIAMRSGECRAVFCTPEFGAGPWPSVILFMDAPGFRPALWDHADHLAALGYLVIAPDLFYRQGPYAAMPAKERFSDPGRRAQWLAERMTPLTPELVSQDIEDFVAFLRQQPDNAGMIGVSGYCMGGAMAMRAAAAFPDDIKACASYHGGNLASDQPTSPHLLVERIKAEIYIACATDDPTFPEEQKLRLEAALTQAGRRYSIETYDALHGFTFPDTMAYSPEAAQRQWTTMTDLFARNLRPTPSGAAA